MKTLTGQFDVAVPRGRVRMIAAGMTRRLAATGALCILTAAAAPARPDDLRVPAEFATIQAAVDASVDGDVVLIADGVYTGAGNRDIRTWGRKITIRSENGADTCILDCQNTGRGFRLQDGETSETVLSGLTITNGSKTNDPSSNSGGAIYCDSSAPLITRCVFVSNRANGSYPSGNGGAIMGVAAHRLRVEHCEFEGNLAPYNGGGLCVSGSQDVIVSGCVFVENRAERRDQSGTGGGALAVVSLSNAAVADCEILGNVSAQDAGGVLVHPASSGRQSTLHRCRFAGNSARSAGGLAVNCHEILDCQFIGNTSSTMMGGGSVAYGVIQGCLISGNRALQSIGGVRLWYNTVMRECEVFDNEAEGGNGGGVYQEYDAVIVDCLVTGNRAAIAGGGVYNGDEGTIEGSQIIGNAAPHGAGVFYRHADDGRVLSNCLLAANHAGIEGGGVYMEGRSRVQIRQCTVARNVADQRGGGIYAEPDAAADLLHSILWGNADSTGMDEGAQIRGGLPSIVRCCIMDCRHACRDQDAGNFSSDPLFVDGEGGDFYLSDVRAGQGETSPCVDAGRDRADRLGMGFLTTRVDGRRDRKRVDLGFHAAR
ncbi:MAG: right-handed parallel beta-helix repeat-containing protein [Phycisphaerales bacterium]|nr:right-handed parallel beta-helix repeat-containing protein [Phycisphaerales bacterium]